MRSIYLLLPLLFIAMSCGSASSDKAPETFDATSEKGLAIGTITFESDMPKNDIYRFFYEASSSDKKFNKRNAGKIMLKARNENNKSGFSGDFNNKQTYLFVIEREPGNYAFTQYNYLDHIGPNGMVNFSKPFSIPFEIKKGQITYLGELSYNDLAEIGTPRLVVYGRFDRDMAEFKKKYTNINWDTTADKTVKSGNTGGGIIDFR
ncbi:hypothetical protein D3C87_256060 [compost metagenome]